MRAHAVFPFAKYDDLKECRRLLRMIPGMIECGGHSGVPKCCILFYVTEWIHYTDKQVDRHHKRVDKIFKREEHNDKGFGYIPCPRCLELKNWAGPLKKCPPHTECGRYQRKQLARRAARIAAKKSKYALEVS
jgi:hypothetical protein